MSLPSCTRYPHRPLLTLFLVPVNGGGQMFAEASFLYSAFCISIAAVLLIIVFCPPFKALQYGRYSWDSFTVILPYQLPFSGCPFYPGSLPSDAVQSVLSRFRASSGSGSLRYPACSSYSQMEHTRRLGILVSVIWTGEAHSAGPSFCTELFTWCHSCCRRQ